MRSMCVKLIIQIVVFHAYAVLDATGKFPSGVLTTSSPSSDPGSYDECLDIGHGDPGSLALSDRAPPAMEGRYCSLLWVTNAASLVTRISENEDDIQRNSTNTLKRIRQGVCVPSHCTGRELEALVAKVLNGSNTSAAVSACRSRNDFSITHVQLAVILTSRAEDFDEQYGLAVIKDVAQNLSVSVDVILTLGSYPKDSADFHKAGENQSIRHLVAQSACGVYRKYYLSGVNLHWLPNNPACEAPFKDIVPRLVGFIHVLRQLVSFKTPSATFKVTAIVDVGDGTAMKFLREHRSSLNVTFFKTHQLSQVNDFSDDYCDHSVPVFAYHFALVAPFRSTSVCA
ncbi:hypothetical protein MTO96_038745 [Rhipicephalus appendiculatus]